MSLLKVPWVKEFLETILCSNFVFYHRFSPSYFMHKCPQNSWNHSHTRSVLTVNLSYFDGLLYHALYL